MPKFKLSHGSKLKIIREAQNTKLCIFGATKHKLIVIQIIIEKFKHWGVAKVFFCEVYVILIEEDLTYLMNLKQNWKRNYKLIWITVQRLQPASVDFKKINSSRWNYPKRKLSIQFDLSQNNLRSKFY